MALTRKNIVVKIFSSGGSFINSYSDFNFQGFTKTINGGVGECLIELPTKFDYTDESIALGHNAEIVICDKDTLADTANGLSSEIIYSGYISRISPNIGEKKESVTITLLGHYTRFSLAILRNALQTTLYTESSVGLQTLAPADSADVDLVFRAVIDRFIAETGCTKMDYGGTSIPTSAIQMLYTFERMTYREALDKIKASSSENYYYYFAPSGLIYFKEIASTPVHKFILGRHFSSIQIENSIENVRNEIYIWDGQAGGSYIMYEDANSIAMYGQRSERLTDRGIGNVSTMDNIGNAFINSNKNPGIKFVCEIFDNNIDANFGYDIESVNPGDTCSFFNFDSEFATLFRERMVITDVEYKLDRIKITAQQIRTSLADVQSQIRRNIVEIVSDGIPVTYDLP